MEGVSLGFPSFLPPSVFRPKSAAPYPDQAIEFRHPLKGFPSPSHGFPASEKGF
jgi:hypothetical protein